MRVEQLQSQRRITTAMVAECIEAQVRAIVDRLRPQNVSDYLDLPDGARIASIKRIDRTAALPFQLLRND